MIFRAIRFLFSSKRERIIASHTAEQQRGLMIKTQVLIDQMSYSELARSFELMSTISNLSEIALNEKRDVIVKGAQKSIIVNYLGQGKTRPNYL